jgi:hypothetical protein
MPNVSHSTTTRNSAFADDALAELSRLIGLTGGQSQLHYQDLLEGEALTHHLHLTKQPAALGRLKTCSAVLTAWSQRATR